MGSVPHHTPAAKFDDIPGELPTGRVPQNADFAVVAKTALEMVNHLQKESLTSNAIWRDLLAFTDTFRTIYSADAVLTTFETLSQEKSRSAAKSKDTSPRLTKAGDSSWLEVDFTFTIKDKDLTGSCEGTASVTPDADGQWKIWMLRTWLESWEGHGHPDQAAPTTTPHASKSATEGSDQVYDTILVGGGQGGLSIAGRLHALGLSHVLFESHPHIGDQWANRYDSLRWHTNRDYSGLPFGYTFSEEDDEMVPTKRIASGHKEWAEKYGINARTGITVKEARWDKASKLWTVKTSSSEGGATWKSRNLVLCIRTGHLTPVYPDWALPERVKASGFAGEIVHGSKYHNANAFAGKRGIVVGTANTGHDVAEDMANAGMDTTIVQRSSTFIFPVEWLRAKQAQDYHRQKPVHIADREQLTYPNKIMRDITNLGVHEAVTANPERFDALEKAGFKVERYGDLYNNLFVRFGGHYVDIGTSARIAKGEIKVKAQAVRGLTQDGLLFEDGTETKADLIVLATGFNHDFRADAAQILGSEVAEQMDDFWGLNSEGEIRAHGRLAGHPHLWYFGGDTRMARYFSRFTTLQIQKECLGNPLRPFEKSTV